MGSVDKIVQALVQDLGVAFGADDWAAQELAAGQLARVHVEGLSISTGQYYVCRANEPLTELAHNFVDVCKEMVGPAPESAVSGFR